MGLLPPLSRPGLYLLLTILGEAPPTQDQRPLFPNYNPVSPHTHSVYQCLSHSVGREALL